MIKLYSVLLYCLIPFILLRLLWRSIKAPAYRQRIKERFGFFKMPCWEQSIWIHAVSVGEMIAITPLVKKLQTQYPDIPIVITTTTPTGSARVKALFGESVWHVYFPYDLVPVLNRFLNQIKPAILIMVETEIWANLLIECDKRQIPTLLANARLSQKSAKGYAKLGQFSQHVFSKIKRVAAQTPTDAAHFIQLGVPKARVSITGSIKFDIQLPASLSEQAQVLQYNWGNDRPVWVAASTHEGEEDILLNIQKKLKQKCPQVLLVLIPRHPERFEKVAKLIKKYKLTFQKRSTGLAQPKDEVYLVDSMGEVPLFYAAADIAFVGGSLIARGGHNILEAAALGVPVLFGSYMFNFQSISEMIINKNAGIQIQTQAELAKMVKHWLSNASERARIGENARQAVAENVGALDKLFLLIQNELEKKAILSLNIN